MTSSSEPALWSGNIVEIGVHASIYKDPTESQPIEGLRIRVAITSLRSEDSNPVQVPITTVHMNYESAEHLIRCLHDNSFIAHLSATYSHTEQVTKDIAIGSGAANVH